MMAIEEESDFVVLIFSSHISTGVFFSPRVCKSAFHWLLSNNSAKVSFFFSFLNRNLMETRQMMRNSFRTEFFRPFDLVLKNKITLVTGIASGA